MKYIVPAAIIGGIVLTFILIRSRPASPARDTVDEVLQGF